MTNDVFFSCSAAFIKLERESWNGTGGFLSFLPPATRRMRDAEPVPVFVN